MPAAAVTGGIQALYLAGPTSRSHPDEACGLLQEKMDAFIDLGYLGLFSASFLAATILPLSSEVVLSYLLLNAYDPFLLNAVATCGNVLGSLANYGLGYWGSIFLAQKVLRMSEDALSAAGQRFKKYGVYSLFFAWVPVIGDPLTVTAGILKINVLMFLVLVTAGKLLRYVILSYAILQQ